MILPARFNFWSRAQAQFPRWKRCFQVQGGRSDWFCFGCLVLSSLCFSARVSCRGFSPRRGSVIRFGWVAVGSRVRSHEEFASSRYSRKCSLFWDQRKVGCERPQGNCRQRGNQRRSCSRLRRRVLGFPGGCEVFLYQFSWYRLVHRSVVKVAVRLFAFGFEGLARHLSNSAKNGFFRISRKFSWELVSLPTEIRILATGSGKKKSTKIAHKFGKKR